MEIGYCLDCKELNYAMTNAKGMLREGEPLINGITKTDIPLDKNGMPVFKPIDLIDVISFVKSA